MNPDTQGVYVGPSYQAAGGHDVIPISPGTINEARSWLQQSLQAALDHASLGRVDAQSLLLAAEKGEALIVFVVERATLQVKGVAAAELFTSISGRTVAHITALAGRDMEQWLGDFLQVGEHLAREQGAQSITLLGRPGWREVLGPHGYERLAVMLGKDLEQH